MLGACGIVTTGGSSAPVGTPGAVAAAWSDVALDVSAAAEAATIGLIDEARAPVVLGVGPVVDAGVVSAGKETPGARGGASFGADGCFFVLGDGVVAVVVDGIGCCLVLLEWRVMVGVSPLGWGLMPMGE